MHLHGVYEIEHRALTIQLATDRNAIRVIFVANESVNRDYDDSFAKRRAI